MYGEILEKNLRYIRNQKIYFSGDTEIKEAVKVLNEAKILTLSGLRHTGKTQLIHGLLQKTQSFENCFYYNSDIDTLGTIKTQQDMIVLLDMYVRIYGIPKIIVLQNSNNIDNIKNFIIQLYKTKKYKLIIVGNNIKIEGVRDIELFPLGIDTHSFENRAFGGIPQVRIIPDISYKDFLLDALKHDIVSRDILEAYTIKNISLFYHVISYLAQTHSYTSLREMHRNLEQYGISISLLTMIDYISAAVNTKLLSGCTVYDLKKQDTITSRIQYFFGDVGIRRAFSDTISLDENILFLEFKRRGYEVFGGLNGRFEFSFRAIKDTQEYCIHLETSTNKDEVRKSARKLAKITGSSQKYLVVLNKAQLGIRKFEEEGVKIGDMLECIAQIM